MTREVSASVDYKPTSVGNYKMTGKILGKGSFAIVEEAIHTHLKVKVSMKTINLLKCNTYVLKHLKREAEILQQLDHPNILHLFEAMKWGHTYFMVTEIIYGGNLCEYMRQQRSKRLDEKTTRMFSRQITEALSYMHGKGIVHRDLKLDNIMLDLAKQNIKLVDFGLSNNWRADNPLQTRCGSPEYSAPELFMHGVQYGPEVDMWALGVIMYAMAGGQLPFPCVSDLKKGSDKRSRFIELVYQGLSDAHIQRIVSYQPEFVSLLKGLINPNTEKRITVEDTIKDPWLSNKNHWTKVRHATFDAYDLARIVHLVCGQLEITEDRLRAELRNRPCGEIAGFYKIVLYGHSYSKKSKDETSNLVTEVSTRSIMRFPPKGAPRYSLQKDVVSKIWVVGAAHKINDVIKGKKPLNRSIHTCTSSSSSHQNSDRSFCSNKSEFHNTKPAAGDWVSTIRKEHQIDKKLSKSSPLNSPKLKNVDAPKIIPINGTLKKINIELQHHILPSRLKPRYPVNNTK